MATAAKARPKQPQRLTTAERAEAGRAARRKVPRASHAAFEPGTRPDPVAVLERQSAKRVPELVPIRYGRMLSSPFAFFRGAAAIMAGDLAATPRTGITVQCCGDAHLSNFGMFGTPERQLVFDINDFDETLPGPWEWDLKRLAASLLIAAQVNGCSAKQRQRAVSGATEQYRTAIAEFAGMKNLDVWYAHLDVDAALAEFGPQLRPKQVKQTKHDIAKARTHDSMSAASKLTRVVDGKRGFVSEPPLIVPISELAAAAGQESSFEIMQDLVRRYRSSLQHDRRLLLEEFELSDFARKVVGVGSVGTRDWIALLLGRDERDPLLLQVKEAERSVLEDHLPSSEFRNHGKRVVAGQHLMQASSDIFLGWLHVDAGFGEEPRDFYCRQLKDWKGSAEIDRMNAKGLAEYGRLCGWTLARAHARSGDRHAIAGYVGAGPELDRAILEFSEAYAEQNERDYKALEAAVADGRIKAERGV